MYWYGEHQKLETSVSELLGPTLLDLHEKCSSRFSLSTVQHIALQLLSALEALHGCGYLHGDIKPDNAAIGLDDKANLVFLIDFGLATRYRDEERHITLELEEKFRGNPYWSSVNTLRGLTSSRRDDLESLGYMLLFLLKGRLPWHSVAKKSFEARKEKLKAKKEAITLEELCECECEEMLQYMRAVKRLKFEETPDYVYFRSLFEPSSALPIPPLDWTVSLAAQSLIQARLPPVPVPTQWDCNCSGSSSNSSEADDSVHPLSPSFPSVSPSRRRQTVSNLPVMQPVPSEERRQSLSEQYDQLERLAMSPGQLLQKEGTVAGRRNSCLPVMQSGEEAERRKLPEMSQALRLKLKQMSTGPHSN